MRSQAFIGITVLVATAVLVLFGISALSPLEPKTAENANNATVTPLERPTVVFGNPYKGLQSAKVTVVEFGDYLCAPCADLDETLNKLLADFPAHMRVVWKDFPNTASHPEALNAAMASRCAGVQGKFWEYHDLILADQLSINAASYVVFAQQLGLDTAAFSQCMDRSETQPVVERDFEEGQRLRIDGTPYLFINDRRISGALDYDSLHSLVSSAVAAAGQTPDANANASVTK